MITFILKRNIIFEIFILPPKNESTAKSLWPNQYCQNKRGIWRVLFRGCFAVHRITIWIISLRPHSILKLTSGAYCGRRVKNSSRRANARVPPTDCSWSRGSRYLLGSPSRVGSSSLCVGRSRQSPWSSGLGLLSSLTSSFGSSPWHAFLGGSSCYCFFGSVSYQWKPKRDDILLHIP